MWNRIFQHGPLSKRSERKRERESRRTQGVMPPRCALQHPFSCLASSRGCSRVHGPSVVPSAGCDWKGAGDPFVPHLNGAAIVLVLGFNRSYIRPSFSRNPYKSYADSALLALRCILSLRRVGTRLPIELLVSGERDRRWEYALRGLSCMCPFLASS